MPKPPNYQSPDQQPEKSSELKLIPQPASVRFGCREPEAIAPPITTEGAILRDTLLKQHFTDPNVMKFIDSYLQCFSITQACKMAGIHYQSGLALYRRPDIVEAVRRIVEHQTLKHGIDGNEIVERVKEVIRVDFDDIYKADGSFKHIKDMKPETQRAIKKFKVKNLFGVDPNGMQVVIGEVIELEFWDKLKSVELLGREKDLFKETKVHQHDVSNRMGALLLESKSRGEKHVDQMKDVTPTVGVRDDDGGGA